MSDDPLLDARKILVDVVELLCHEIIMSAGEYERRQSLAEQLDYFLERLDDHCEFGRICCRRRLAELALVLGAVDPYKLEEEVTTSVSDLPPPKKKLRSSEEKDDEESSQKKGYSSYTPLVSFTMEQWDDVLNKFDTLKELLLRMDSTTLIIPDTLSDLHGHSQTSSHGQSENEGENMDSTIDEELTRNKYFGRKYKQVLDIVCINKSLSFLRPTLEQELDHAPEGRDSARVSPDVVLKFEEYVSANFEEGDNTRELLLSLLNRGKGSIRTRSGGLSLKSMDDLMHKMNDTPDFDLYRLQRKADSLLQNWSDAVFEKPKLAELGYGGVYATSIKCDEEEMSRSPGFRTSIQAGYSKRTSGKEKRKDTDIEPHEASSASHATAPADVFEYSEEDGAEAREQRTDEASASKKPGGAVISVEKACTSSSQYPEKEGGKGLRVGLPSKDVEGENSHLTEVEALVHARETLKNDVRDPLNESRTIAEAAMLLRETSRRRGNENQRAEEGSFLKKKASSTKITFDDSDNESVEDAKALTEVPEHARLAPSQGVLKYESTHPNLTTKGHRKRRRFTEEEKTAIKLGVRKFGFGKWSNIKDYYGEELRSRTSVDIKDCYRNMMKRNEV